MTFRCEVCGKPVDLFKVGFQTWQVANRKTGKHRTASWCSDAHYKLAEKGLAGLKKHYTKKGICNYCAGVEKVWPKKRAGVM